MNDLVFLIDVDNTLLDNDRFAGDLRARLTADFGSDACDRYWSIYSELRDQRGFADYLGTLQQFRGETDDESALLRMSQFLLEYPFADLVYPNALAAMTHAGSIGLTTIVSDGDIVFQPRKIQRSGLWDAVDARVLIYLHKELRLDAIKHRFPARHYVMVDDKPSLLIAAKNDLGTQLTTIFVRQGHYAAEVRSNPSQPVADYTIDAIGDLRKFSASDFLSASPHATRAADPSTTVATNMEQS